MNDNPELIRILYFAKRICVELVCTISLVSDLHYNSGTSTQHLFAQLSSPFSAS
jgi:hypothetical protein